MKILLRQIVRGPWSPESECKRGLVVAAKRSKLRQIVRRPGAERPCETLNWSSQLDLESQARTVAREKPVSCKVGL